MSVPSELPQHQIFKEEEVLTENQACNSSVDQEESEPPQIKDEEEELCISHKGDQLELKQEAVTLMVTPVPEESNHCEPEPKTDHQPLCHNSHVAESQDQREPKSKERKIYSDDVKTPKLLEILNDTQTGEKLFKCDTCGKSYKYKGPFEAHMKMHTDGEPYSCTTCKRRFRGKWHLTVHTRIHKGS